MLLSLICRLFMSDGGGRVKLVAFNYCTDLFNQETIECISAQF